MNVVCKNTGKLERGMKRANGTGSVIKHSGKRRRPYEARVTVGRDGQRRQIARTIGWYVTRDEALAALLAYNKSPYDIDTRHVTFAKLFERWYARAAGQGRLAAQSLNCMKSAYKRYCASLANTLYANIRAYMMQGCIDTCHGCASAIHVKNLFHNLDNYAMELDIIGKRYSDLVHIPMRQAARKTIFSDFEVARLWGSVETPYVDTVLILLYSGWRISEFLGLRKENVHIDPTGKTVNTMRGGVKTMAGRDRVVPIHRDILPLVSARYQNAQSYLIEKTGGKPMTMRRYRTIWARIMSIIGARHTPHETRHTFRSWLDTASAPLSCVNRIMGHSCGDIGLQVYTHKTVEQLAAAVELIKTECEIKNTECEIQNKAF